MIHRGLVNELFGRSAGRPVWLQTRENDVTTVTHSDVVAGETRCWRMGDALQPPACQRLLVPPPAACLLLLGGKPPSFLGPVGTLASLLLLHWIQ